MNANIKFRETTSDDSAQIAATMKEYWGGEPLVIRGKNYFPSKLNGIIAESGDKLMGFLFYELQGNDCEIVVFEVFDKYQGLGTRFLDLMKQIAKKKQCTRLYLMTTNDHLDALRFYQRRGFTICGIHLNSVAIGRKMKPGIPEVGEYGIPLRDEIDLELVL
jgi:GNAT superfamily N-acetyltransferase